MVAHGCSYLIQNTACCSLQGCGGIYNPPTSPSHSAAVDYSLIVAFSPQMAASHHSSVSVLPYVEMTFQLQSNFKSHSIFCNRQEHFHRVTLSPLNYLFSLSAFSLGDILFSFSCNTLLLDCSTVSDYYSVWFLWFSQKLLAALRNNAFVWVNKMLKMTAIAHHYADVAEGCLTASSHFNFQYFSPACNCSLVFS